MQPRTQTGFRSAPIGIALVLCASWLAAGCGSDPDTSHVREAGGISFRVQATEVASIQSVWIEMIPDPDHAASRYDDNPTYRVELTYDGREWKGREERIYAGVYRVTAYAFDHLVPLRNLKYSKEIAAYVSSEREVEIVANQNSRIVFILYEQVEDDVLPLPRFRTVHFDREVVEQIDVLRIDVEADGGDSPLTRLSGLYPAGAQPGTRPGESGVFGPDYDFAGGTDGWLSWTPPRRQDVYPLRLWIGNESGHEAELGIEVEVGVDRGDVDFKLLFNHAPEAKVRSDVANDANGTSITLEALIHDWEGDDVTYSWSHDCGADFTWMGTVIDTVASGTQVEIELEGQGTRPQGTTCGIALELEDDGDSRRLIPLEVPVGWLGNPDNGGGP